jgi:5-(carboxyamino)imidazole ribonucleotide mutase
MLELKPDPNPESSSGASQPDPHTETRPEPPSPRAALVGIIMGSRSDWPTLEHTAKVLDELGVPYEAEVLSAHRTPDRMFDYAATAESRGIRVIIAGAGGAAHLPGMVAAKTRLPVLGVPVQTHALHGVDSLLSIVQMPGGVPVATFAIGHAGAKNAGLFAASILALNDSRIAEALESFRRNQTDSVLSNPDPRA